mmetsp:Transcript_12959/g.52161  ORF Transcript_12959/g.52161 Transcript_12959/m.52161 type:complete len:255 (+) Transcript_12959:3606-4370(+)
MFDLQKFYYRNRYFLSSRGGYAETAFVARTSIFLLPSSSVSVHRSLLSSFLRLESKPCASPSCAARSIPVANSPNATFVLDTSAYVVAPSMKTLPTKANSSIRVRPSHLVRVCPSNLEYARACSTFSSCSTCFEATSNLFRVYRVTPMYSAAPAPEHKPRKNPGVMSSAHSFGIGFRVSLYRSRDSSVGTEFQCSLMPGMCAAPTTPTTFFTRARPAARCNEWARTRSRSSLIVFCIAGAPSKFACFKKSSDRA